jgi:hypothetical protein
MLRIVRLASPLLLFVLVVFSAEGVSAKKPLPPLQVTIALVRQDIAPADIKPGETVDLVVKAVSMIDAPDMKINIELKGGVESVSGSLSWTGSAVQGEEKVLLITVRAPAKGHGRIKARASIHISNGPHFSAETLLALGNEEQVKPAKSPPIKKDSRGRDVMEFR